MVIRQFTLTPECNAIDGGAMKFCRYRFAAELRSEGIDIGIVSKQLDHTSIATTARYLDHIAPFAVVAAIASRRRQRRVS